MVLRAGSISPNGLKTSMVGRILRHLHGVENLMQSARHGVIPSASVMLACGRNR